MILIDLYGLILSVSLKSSEANALLHYISVAETVIRSFTMKICIKRIVLFPSSAKKSVTVESTLVRDYILTPFLGKYPIFWLI